MLITPTHPSTEDRCSMNRLYNKVMREEVDNFLNDLVFFSILFSIDATKHNKQLGRLVNDGDGVHEPVNCVMRKLPFDPSCTSSPPICLFALRDIQPGEELRYDYGNPELPWRKVNIVYNPSLHLVQNVSLVVPIQ